MMSTSLGHHSQILEEAPSWEEIASSLKCLLCDQELDLSRLGTKSRMQYEDFEIIFCHLYSLIDPKYRLKSFRAARNADERKSFIETAVRLINDKQLHPQRVSSSQLYMFGGEPFRRILGSMIKIATERFDQIAEIIPKIELETIGKGQNKSNSDIRSRDIEKILEAYPDDRYDSWVIGEVTRKNFS